MTNTKSRADLCLREAYTCVLAAALGMPEYRSCNASVKFDNINNPTDRRLLALVERSVAQRQHTIVSIWTDTDTDTDEPQTLVMIRQHPAGAEIVPVEIARPHDDRVMVLVSGDRQRIFTLTEQCAIRETDCWASEGLEQAVGQGREELGEAVSAFWRAAVN